MWNRAAFSAFALGLTLAVPAAALDRQSALGSGGEVFIARTGTRAQLFQGSGPGAGNAALALDLVRADATVQRLLVPGTDDEAVESSPFLVYEPTAGALFMVWQSQQGFIHPMLNVVCFKDGQFGKVISVSGNPSGFSDKSASQIAITRDEHAITGEDGVTRTIHRTVLHLLWWEGDRAGDKILYSPITLLDGAFRQPFEIYTLNDLDTGQPEPSIADVAAELYRAPRIQSGRNDHTVVVAFANPRTGRLVTAEISVLPGEISYLGDDLRAHIIEIGARPSGLPNATTLGDALRAHIIEIGHRTRLNRDVLQYLGSDLRAHIIEIGSKLKSDPKTLAENARERLILSGANLLENGVDRADDSLESSARIVEVGRHAEPDLASQLIQFRVAAARPAPRTGAAPTTLYASEDGRKGLIAWEIGGMIRYRETEQNGWSKINTLLLGESLSRERADQILERRVRH